MPSLFTSEESKKMSTTKLCAAGTLLCAAAIRCARSCRRSRTRDRAGETAISIGLWGDLALLRTRKLPEFGPDRRHEFATPRVLGARRRLEGRQRDSGLDDDADEPCSNELYQQALDSLNALQAPAMFTPGDNDWTRL
jgi:hypothetical protein